MISLRREAKDSYAAIAGFYQADLLLTANKTDEALKVLDEIAADEQTPPPMKNMALFSKVSVAVDAPNADYAALDRELDSLIEKETAWDNQAYEIKAVIALKTKDVEKAKAYLKKIVASPTASGALRTRSEENLNLLEQESAIK